MEKAKKIAIKAFHAVAVAVAVAGVIVAVCTADGSAHEIALRLSGVAAFIGGLIGWSLTGKEAA